MLTTTIHYGLLIALAIALVFAAFSLALRSLADNDAELERAIAAGDIAIPDNATPEQEERLLKAAMARPIDKGTTFVTGGDVSRFQRKTMPPQDSDRAAQYTPPSPGVSARVDSQPVYRGPSVRVTRGKATEEIPVSPQASACGMLRTQGQATRRGGQAVTSTLSYWGE